MDVLSNDGVTSSSVLESTKSAQKNFQDVYAALDATLVAGSGMLSVGVDVQIGDKSYDEPVNQKNAASLGSSRISIANVAQATVAPELRDLRAGQDFHNKLQTAGAGLEEIRSNLDKIYSQVGTPQQYAQNPVVRAAIDSINKTLLETTYGGEQMFNMFSLYSDKPAIDVPEVAEVTRGIASEIQSTIMVNAERVLLDEGGTPLTKGTETFMISQSNSSKVFSFPEETPLDKINQVIDDATQDPAIKPMIYFENRGNGELAIVTGESEGPVEFGSSLTVSAIDGELFAVPLDTYSKERGGGFNQRDGRVVQGDKSMMMLSEELGDNKTAGAINLARDNVVNGLDVDNMRTSNHALSRTEQFNERLGADRNEGDGFAVTPVDPGASSGSLTAGSQLRDNAKSANVTRGFDGAAPAQSEDVMLLPEENTVAPYLTLQQREAGLTGGESLDQSAKVTRTMDDAGLESERPERYRTMLQIQNGVLGAETLNQLVRMTAAESAATSLSVPADTGSEERSAQAGNNPLERAVNSEVAGEETAAAGIAAAAREKQTAAAANLELGSVAQSTLSDSGRSQNSESAPVSADSADSTPVEAMGNTGSNSADDLADKQDRPNNKQAPHEVELPQSQVYSGVNPVSKLENLQGVINETLSFTLRGKRGEMDFVIAAGVRVDTLSLAINTTSNITGVTSNTANGRIALEGASSNELEVSSAGASQGGMDVPVNDAGAGMEQRPAAGSGVSDSAAAGNARVGNNSSAAAASVESSLLDSTTLGLNIDLSNLGGAEGREQIYNVLSFAQQDAPAELAQNPQLARRILSSAYNQLNTLQSNIESLLSVNARNTLEVSERIEERMLGGLAGGIGTPGDSEAALNRVTVGLSNSVSANVGGYGSSPLASLNLLGSVGQGQRARAIERFDLADLNDPAYRLAAAMAASTYGVDSEVGENAGNNPAGIQDVPGRGATVTLLERIAKSVEQARTNAQEIREVFELGVQNRGEIQDIVERAEDRFFANIENARETIRELGRDYEKELYKKEEIEENASKKMYDERQEQLGTPQAENKFNAEIIYPGAANAALGDAQRAIAEEGVAGAEEMEAADTVVARSNLNKALAKSGLADFNAEKILKVESAPASVLNSAAVAAPVAVTAAVQGNMAQPTPAEENKYTSLVKLFEDKMGTVVVHGQDYTMKDLESNVFKLLESKPEVVKTVIDKTIEDVEMIARDLADLQSQELEELGGALMAALDTYGSEQSASNPRVAEHARYVRGQPL